jgi:hypothetical protein
MPSGIYEHKRGIRKHSLETIRKITETNRKTWENSDLKSLISSMKKGNKNMLGKHHSEKTRKILSDKHKGTKKPWVKPPHYRGEKHWNWRGGTSSLPSTRKFIENT